ncbi:LysE family translocator [Uliginosibacterium sp. H3]|uniref:LysE family translocator n=1 Tax=Uliginosibacterium silvisoli TaxID=3114758 RepID=A0ABU6JZ19_9RHOO|nr:LysE family translocator [Uliginosibacterium sp. H3]
MSIYYSMAAFALAASISPGPVNIVSLSAGAQHGVGPGMRHVSGATIGFTVLLLLVGLGLHALLTQYPILLQLIRWAGIAFFLYMAFMLATDSGELDADHAARQPSFMRGAIMQWLNPKAWLAAAAGMGAFAGGGDTLLVWQFSAIYFVICYLSLACWVVAGSFLRPYISKPARVRLFNRVMAALLTGCALALIVT